MDWTLDLHQDPDQDLDLDTGPDLELDNKVASNLIRFLLFTLVTSNCQTVVK